MLESPIFWHRVRFPFIFLGIIPGFPLFSLTSRLDLIFLLETRLIFSYIFWHRVQIPLAFFGSVPGSFSPSVMWLIPLTSLWLCGDKIVGHLNSSLKFISLIHCLQFAFVTHSFIHSTEEGHICRPSILSLDTCILITTQKVLFCAFNSLCFKHFCVVVLHLYSNWHVEDLAMTYNHICG